MEIQKQKGRDHMGGYPQINGSGFQEEEQVVVYDTPMEFRARQIAWAYNYPPLNPMPGGMQQNRTIQALRDPRIAQLIQVLS